MQFIQQHKQTIIKHKHLISSEHQDNDSYSFELDMVSGPSYRLAEEQKSKPEMQEPLRLNSFTTSKPS